MSGAPIPGPPTNTYHLTPGTPGTCHVCGDALPDDNAAVCNSCANPFHLRLRNDAEGRDCGDVWINEQFLSLEFACFTCLRGAGSMGAGEPPVGKAH